jgi:integrase
MKFTELYLKNLKPKEKRYVINEGRGFQFYVHPTGTKSFYLRYTFGGKEKLLCLGEYPTISLSVARDEYESATKKVRAGIDPALPPEPTVDDNNEKHVTVSWMVEQYLTWSEKNHSPNWHSIVKVTANKHLIPAIGERPITSIRKRDAIELMEQISKSGDGAARNALKIIRGVFDYACEREYIDASPFLRLARAVPKLAQASRQRVLSDKEIKTVWESIITGVGSNEVKRAILFVLITAQRPGECAGIHTSEIDGDWWTIPAERARKGKRDHLVFLTKTAKLLLGKSEDYFFNFYDGKPITEGSLPQLISSKSNYYGLERWTPHDLRRTSRTLMARLGIIEEEAEAVLNHAKQGMSKVYNLHKYKNEKKVALTKLESEIKKIIGTKNYQLLTQLCKPSKADKKPASE